MDPRQVQRFGDEEARKKIGRTIRSLKGFAGVPRGTTGRVIDIYHYGGDGNDVVIEWNLPDRDKPVHDRFAKSSYERLLVEE